MTILSILLLGKDEFWVEYCLIGSSLSPKETLCKPESSVASQMLPYPSSAIDVMLGRENSGIMKSLPSGFR